jgi:hypothetical protein
VGYVTKVMNKEGCEKKEVLAFLKYYPKRDWGKPRKICLDFQYTVILKYYLHKFWLQRVNLIALRIPGKSKNYEVLQYVLLLSSQSLDNLPLLDTNIFLAYDQSVFFPQKEELNFIPIQKMSSIVIYVFIILFIEKQTRQNILNWMTVLI